MLNLDLTMSIFHGQIFFVPQASVVSDLLHDKKIIYLSFRHNLITFEVIYLDNSM